MKEHSFEDYARELLHHELWELRSLMEAGPIGETSDYTPPTADVLPDIEKALMLLLKAKETLKQCIPEAVQFRLSIEEKKHADFLLLESKHDPSVRRFSQVDIVSSLVKDLFMTLRDEGRPQPPPNLTLGKMRRSS